MRPAFLGFRVALSFLFLGCSLAFSLLGLGLTAPAHAQSGPAIAAAADLQFVLGEISFEGLLLASLVANLPFAIQPMQRGFEAIPIEVRDAAACSGLSPWRVLWKIDLPLAWPGIVTGLVLAFAHTLGEFGVVLMVGGSIPGETRTIAIAIYDRVQAFDNRGAAVMSATLLALSLLALGITYMLSNRVGRRHA